MADDFDWIHGPADFAAQFHTIAAGVPALAGLMAAALYLRVQLPKCADPLHGQPPEGAALEAAAHAFLNGATAYLRAMQLIPDLSVQGPVH